MRKATVLASALVLIGMGSSAQADGYRGASAPAIAYNWTGVYFGGSVGYGWGDADIREDLSISVPGVGPLLSAKDSHNVDGWLGGVQLGAMKQFGWLVAGTEFSLSGGNIEGSTGDCAGLTTASGGLVGVNCNSKVNWLASAVGRAGVAFDRVLVYGSLGYAIAGVDHTIALNIPATTPAVTIAWAKSDVAHGVAFGGGFEYAVARDIMLGLDYLHADLESRGDGIVLGGALSTGKRDVDLNVITARLSYKFGGDCCAAAPMPLK
jgi:outer membrane immunogenic protein